MRYNLYQAQSNGAAKAKLALSACRKPHFPSGESRSFRYSPARSDTLPKLSLTIAVDQVTGMIVSFHIECA